MNMYFPWLYYWLFTGLSFISAIGSGAISKTIAGWPAAKLSWMIAFCLVAIYSFMAAIFWYRQRNSVRNSFYVIASVCVSLMSLALALAIPVFYILPIWTPAGLLLLALFLAITSMQLIMAFTYFNKQWELKGEKLLHASIKNNKLDMDLFNKKFKTSAPNITDISPPWLGFSVKALLILSLLIGLNFRKIYPILSAFAWAIPSMIIVGVLSQIALMAILRGYRIAAFEKRLGTKLMTYSSF